MLKCCCVRHCLFMKVTPITSQTAVHVINTTFDRAKRNIVKTLLIVGCCFVTCSTANEILYLMVYFGLGIDFLAWHYKLTLVPVVCICCINPVIYSAKYLGFKHGTAVMIERLSVCLRGRLSTVTIAAQ